MALYEVGVRVRATGGEGRRARLVAEALVVALAVAVLAGAWRVDVEWFERHWALRASHAWVVHAWRAAGAAMGVLLATTGRRRAGRWVERVGGREASIACVRVVVALALALGVSEATLRVLGRPRRHDLAGSCDTRMAEPDPRYGWVWKRHYSKTTTQGWRDIRYDFDGERARASSPQQAPDPGLPTILFAGESIMAGHGLHWEESLPARVSAALGLQVVDLGVDGYASDQAFLRLADTLPRYPHVVAVVTLFFPALVDRVAWIDHPRLWFEGDEPRVETAAPFWSDLRVTRVVRDVLPYRDEASLALTATVFRQTARLAEARGAKALFLTPYLGQGWPRDDSYLIDRLLRAQGLQVIDPRWDYEPILGDRHPNAASTRRLADATIAALATQLTSR